MIAPFHTALQIGVLAAVALAVTDGHGGPPEPDPHERRRRPAPWGRHVLPRQTLRARPIGPLLRMPRQWGPDGPPPVRFLDETEEGPRP